jgi:hypothetical protein
MINTIHVVQTRLIKTELRVYPPISTFAMLVHTLCKCILLVFLGNRLKTGRETGKIGSVVLGRSFVASGDPFFEKLELHSEGFVSWRARLKAFERQVFPFLPSIGRNAVANG